MGCVCVRLIHEMADRRLKESAEYFIYHFSLSVGRMQNSNETHSY